MSPARINMLGKQAGRLTVISDTRPMICKCECGEQTLVSIENFGKSIWSCGCLKREMQNPNYRHGGAGSKLYMIWEQMLQRCENSRHARWKDYGGRGIVVCPQWHSFEQFRADMGERPDGHSLDRIDNDGPYSPDNCRWATAEEQRNNRRPQAPVAKDPVTGRFRKVSA